MQGVFTINKEIEIKIRQYIENGNYESAKRTLIPELKQAVDGYSEGKYTSNNDVSFAHYTSIETLYSILKSYKPSKIPSPKQKTTTDSDYQKLKNGKGCIRLYDAFYINDPNEGKILRDAFEKEYPWLKKAKQDTNAFICSFVHGDKNENIGDKLMYWQSYGKNGLGCSIQLSPDYDHTKELRRVIYGKGELKNIQNIFQKHFELATKLFYKIDKGKKEDFATDFWKAFDQIKFLHKDKSYEDENEYRLVKIVNEAPPEIEYDLKSEGPYLRRFVLDERLIANKILITGSKIFVGPTVRKANHMCQNLQELAKSKGLPGPKLISSEISYQKFW